ncbi:MAG: flagellar FlbD family protein [Christensenellales bacterium]
MVRVHRLNNQEFLINCELIEFVEETPNTVVSMVSGRKLVVSETTTEIQKLIIEYKQKIFCGNALENKELGEQ